MPRALYYGSSSDEIAARKQHSFENRHPVDFACGYIPMILDLGQATYFQASQRIAELEFH